MTSPTAASGGQPLTNSDKTLVTIVAVCCSVGSAEVRGAVHAERVRTFFEAAHGAVDGLGHLGHLGGAAIGRAEFLVQPLC